MVGVDEEMVEALKARLEDTAEHVRVPSAITLYCISKQNKAVSCNLQCSIMACVLYNLQIKDTLGAVSRNLQCIIITSVLYSLPNKGHFGRSHFVQPWRPKNFRVKVPR